MRSGCVTGRSWPGVRAEMRILQRRTGGTDDLGRGACASCQGSQVTHLTAGTRHQLAIEV
jgi:hypothetical protein